MMKNLEQQVSDIIDTIFDEKHIYPEDSPEYLYFIQDILNKVVMKQYGNNPNKLVYHIDGITYFLVYIDSKKDIYVCYSYEYVYDILKTKYSVKWNIDNFKIMKNMLENYLKCEIQEIGSGNTCVLDYWLNNVDKNN